MPKRNRSAVAQMGPKREREQVVLATSAGWDERTMRSLPSGPFSLGIRPRVTV
jgi:hypothetical protein